MIDIWKWFMNLFNCCRHHCCKKILFGEILLGFGCHEIEFKVPGQPCKVCFDIEDDGCCVCHGAINKINIMVGKCGFVIHADINTNTCLIRWHCEYKEV